MLVQFLPSNGSVGFEICQWSPNDEVRESSSLSTFYLCLVARFSGPMAIVQAPRLVLASFGVQVQLQFLHFNNVPFTCPETTKPSK